MKTIKVITLIDLLNKIAKGEEVPKSFKIAGVEYYINDSGFLQECNGEEVQWVIYRSWLNEKVEIIEEEKKLPEKIKSNGKEFYCDNVDSWIDKEKTSAYCEYLMNKYNELIDYLKSKGE